ncbi:MAG: hypothetical protein KDA96_03030 [Planctomycetaceae bacterium]|nr:hypothetical protein [Planctomycetaceae bacterium]
MEKLIVMAVVVFISMIISAIQKAGKGQQPAHRPPADHRERVQSEIEAFLAGGRKDAQGQARPAPPRPAPPRPAPPRAAAQARPSAPARKLRQQSGQPPRPAKQTPPPPRRARPSAIPEVLTDLDFEERPQRRDLSSVDEHVENYIHKHVQSYLDHDVDESVQAEIVDSVQQHLGPRPTARSVEDAVGVSDIVATLRSPAGMRQALILNEILSRPRALRR